MRRPQRGGGRKTVPLPGIDLPDVRDPGELRRLMSFYDLDAHGVMSEKKQSVFLVPENTWILFLTRAGIFSEKVRGETLRTAIENFFYLQKDETEAQWYERIYREMKNGTLFKSILYTNNQKDKFSIYEPGDLIQDLELQFTNTSWPMMHLGVWKCPIPYTVFEKLQIMNNISEMIKYNPEFQGYIQELKTYSNTQSSQEVKDRIDRIIQFMLTEHLLPGYEAIKVYTSDDYKQSMEIPEIKQFVTKFRSYIHLIQGSEEQMKDQYSFFKHPNNLINLSPSIQEGKLHSSLYKILTDKTLKPGGLGIVDEPLLGTSKYKFIVVDSCRSIETPGVPEALYKPRLALTRSLSNIARPEICATNLLQMTRQKFAQLLRERPIPEASAIGKLLRGESVLLPEFESSLLGKNASLRTFLEGQQFQQYQPVFVNDGAGGYTGVVANIDIDPSGKLTYKVIPDVEQPESEYNEGGRVTVPASSVYGTQENILSIRGARLTEQMNAFREESKLRAKYKEQELKKQQEAEEAARKEKELQEKQAKERAEREAQEKTAEEAAKLKFAAEVQAQASKIAALPEEKQKLISYRKKVWINSPGDATFHHRYGYVIGVGAKKNTGELLVAVEIQLLGADPKNFPRKKAFPPSVLHGGLNPTNAAKAKGGRRKTRRSKNSKKSKRTRRH